MLHDEFPGLAVPSIESVRQVRIGPADPKPAGGPDLGKLDYLTIPGASPGVPPLVIARDVDPGTFALLSGLSGKFKLSVLGYNNGECVIGVTPVGEDRLLPRRVSLSDAELADPAADNAIARRIRGATDNPERTLGDWARSAYDGLRGLARNFVSSLDYKQNMGNCGIVSVRNILNMAGVKVSEEQLTAYAMKEGLCARNGGSTPDQRRELLRRFGVETSTGMASMEELAQAAESKRGAVLAIDANALYDPNRQGREQNHAITLTGVKRNSDGSIAGFTVCDSGRGVPGDANRFIPLADMVRICGGNRCLADITSNPIA